MTFDEAIVAVRAGRKVSREAWWFECEAGYEWGPWLDKFVHYFPDEPWPRFASGKLIEVRYNTMCESAPVDLDEAAPRYQGITDWFDCTEQMAKAFEILQRHWYPKGDMTGKKWCPDCLEYHAPDEHLAQPVLQS